MRKKKKQKFIIRFAKIFGLCIAGLTVGLGLVLVGFWIAGEFNPPNIPLTGIVVNDTNIGENSFFSGEYLVINSDTTFQINPQPLDGTEKELILHIDSGADVISVPETAEIGKNIQITALTNEEGIIKGGEALIKISTASLWTTYLKVFVDVPVTDITLSHNAPINMYPGNSFMVSVDSFSPINSQNPSTSTPKIRNNKLVTFYSTNTNVATVDENTGVVNVIASGTFKIGARVFKTFHDEINQPNENDYEYPEDYLEAISTMTVSKETSLLISNDIAVDNIVVTDTALNLNLLSSTNKTLLDLSINLNKPVGSLFTEEQLNYKKYDIVAVGGKLNIQTGIVTTDTTFLTVKKNINTQNVNNTYFTLTSNTYVSSSSRPVLIITFTDLLFDKEGNMFNTLQTNNLIKTVPLNIIKTDVDSLTIQGNNPDDEGNSDIVLELGIANFNLNKNYSLMPSTSTYKTVKFFAKAQAVGSEVISVDTNQMVEISNEMHYLISYTDENQEVFDGIIKTLNVGNVQIYAVVIKTDITGAAIKMNTEGNHFEYALDYYGTVSNVSVVEKINSIIPVLKNENNEILEKTGDIYIFAKEDVVSIDLFANIVGTIDPEATSHNASKIITDAFKYGLLTFSSSNSACLSVFASIKEGVLQVELTAEAIIGQVSFQCFYKELGSENSELMFELTMQIFANTISQLNLTGNNLTDITINASINENSNSVVWDNFTTLLAILPSSANVGNVTVDYRCTTSNVINIEEDSTITNILEITYDENGQPLFTFHKAGVVYIYATLINSEFQRVNSNLIKVTVVTPTILITNKNNQPEEDPLPLNFVSLPGTFNILNHIIVTVIDTNGVSRVSQSGSILQLALIQNDNNRALIGTGAGNEFNIYLGQVAQNRTIKIKLFSELDTIGQVITITIIPDVSGKISYPGGKLYEEVYSGNILDLLADASIVTNEGLSPRVQITNSNKTKNLVTETKQLIDLTEVFVYDIDFSFSTNNAYRLLMGETETYVVQFGTVSTPTSVTISVQIDLTTGDTSAIIPEKYLVNYIVLIKPKVKIDLNYANDKYTHNGVDYLNIFSGSTLNLSEKLTISQIKTTSISGQDIRGTNYTGNILSSMEMDAYTGEKTFEILSTNIGGISKQALQSSVVITENLIEKKINLSFTGDLSSSEGEFILTEFIFIAKVNCDGVEKELNIKYVPLTLGLIQGVENGIEVNTNIIDVIGEYVVATANSSIQSFPSMVLKSKLTLSIVTGGLSDISVINNQLVIGDNPTSGEFIVKIGHGTNEIELIFII